MDNIAGKPKSDKVMLCFGQSNLVFSQSMLEVIEDDATTPEEKLELQKIYQQWLNEVYIDRRD